LDTCLWLINNCIQIKKRKAFLFYARIVDVNKKCIFLDCDGTLFDVPRGMSRYSDKTKYAVEELKKAGHYVFIATGRCKCLLPDFIIDLNPTGFITTNGAYAYMGNSEIFSLPMKDESIELIKNYCKQHDGVYFLEAQDTIHVKDIKNPLLRDFVNTWGTGYSIYTEDLPTNKIYLMMAAFDSEEKCSQAIKDLGDKVDIRRQYGYTSFDIGDFNHDKGQGVKAVLNYLNIDKKDAYAFGDGANDMEMIQAVEESYAMANGFEELKKVAKYIAPDCLEDGFYKMMVKDGLIKPIE